MDGLRWITRPVAIAGVVSAVALIVYGVVLVGAPTSRQVTVAVDDLGQLAAAVAAAVGCWPTAARSRDSKGRCAWGLLAAATASWAAGETVWSYYEIVVGRDVPFPSLADAGFLGFCVLSAAALLVLPVGPQAAASRVCSLLDGMLIAGALLALAWVTSLGVTLRLAADTRLATILALAYPLGDVVVMTLVLLTITRASRGRRHVLGLLALGLAVLAVADSAFVYLTATGQYATGNLCDLGWTAGFLVLLLAAVAAQAPEPTQPGELDTVVPSWLRLALPYAPMALAEGVIGLQLLTQPDHVSAVAVVLGMALVALVLARQFLTVADHQQLILTLGTEREQARHEALHDPLTGLANRNLFTDRVEHAVALRQRDGQPITVFYCDLDDFKSVNDGLGHAAGDELLVAVGDRMRSCLRPADTVARLGGDEFAVLIEQPVEPPSAVAERLVSVLAAPYVVEGTLVTVTASIGLVCAFPAVGDGLGAGELLCRADAAMYAAKDRGKATWILHEPAQ